MKAMLLAAGRGERMMPLTANKPKPMLEVSGKPLLLHHIEQLKTAGITDIVINHAWCGNQITDYFGNGERFGVKISYSDESGGALETAGGIKKALTHLIDNEQDTFLVVNGDIYCQFNYVNLPQLPEPYQACLFLVDNPEHNIAGDFSLSEKVIDGLHWLENKTEQREQTYTFSGIALYRGNFFNKIGGDNKLALGPMFRAAADEKCILAKKFTQPWTDVGTPERLARLNQE